MDNAIEATSECDNKYIHVEIRNDFSRNRQLLIIENTYKNIDVDIEKFTKKAILLNLIILGLDYGKWKIS